MHPRQPRRIAILVSGGIAAYKIPELVRTFIKAGHEVRCAMTAAASEFVTPLVLETLSGASVLQHLFAPDDDGHSEQIDHIELADWAELVVIAPATANRLAKLAHGIADDLVGTVLLATRAPILAAPAMNVNMWQHPATQANVATLGARGVRWVGPDSGELACGWEGAGRMSDPAQIAAAAEQVLASPTLAGRKVLVTAGGTAEPIDTVRTINNRSSGKMGFALANEAALRGADVVLVAGTTALATPHGVRRIDVQTALEMRAAVLAEFGDADIVVKAAAVADFRPARAHDRKLKKDALEAGQGITLELVENPDILAELCRPETKGDRIIVGFAAESHDVVEAARRKIARKGCDLLVANDVSRSDAGFSVDTNAVLLISPDGEVEELPLLSKAEVARQIFDRVEKLGRDAGGQE